MKKIKIFGICFMVFFLPVVLITFTIGAQEKEYGITSPEFKKLKAFYDDPRPFLKDLYKKVLPPEVYTKLTFDLEEMKKLWADCIGFKSPDVVGKIAPEIKPGKYSYKDKEKYPGLKEMMIPEHYKRFNLGGPPHAGNFPEITVVPTRQYYWALPIAEATKKNMDKTKLDDQGYIIDGTYVAGYPFPRPSGKFKAQQIIYNWVKRYLNGENMYLIQLNKGFTKDLREDVDGDIQWWGLRLQGRVLLEPKGWYDERARENGEAECITLKYLSPRDLYGSAFNIVYFLDRDQFDQFLIYINVIRRVRKMSATDTQDAVAGQDVIYEDKDGFSQKLTPKRYPYKFEVIAEREYLVPAPTWDGSLYVSKKGLEYHNIEFERRPMYVVKLTQLDTAYVYSSRTLYVDKETFMVLHAEMNDQKGRLYRDSDMIFAFVPEMGLQFHYAALLRDHVDLHSGLLQMLVLPSPWVGRQHVSLQSLVTKGK